MSSQELKKAYSMFVTNTIANSNKVLLLNLKPFHRIFQVDEPEL